MAKIPIILEPGRADGKLIKTNSVYDDNQEKFLSDKIKEIDDNHNTLTDIVNNNKTDIENKLETEKNRATNVENSLRETINNITNINEHATTAELVTVNTLPNSTVSNAQQALDDLYKNIIYDISQLNGGIVFESLQSLLSSSNLDTLIPTSIRRGGMSIRFVQSSDNKYVQYRLMFSTFTTAQFTNTANWQGVDEEPTVGSDNLVESGGSYNAIKSIDYKIIKREGSYVRETTGEQEEVFFDFGALEGEKFIVKTTKMWDITNAKLIGKNSSDGAVFEVSGIIWESPSTMTLKKGCSILGIRLPASIPDTTVSVSYINNNETYEHRVGMLENTSEKLVENIDVLQSNVLEHRLISTYTSEEKKKYYWLGSNVQSGQTLKISLSTDSSKGRKVVGKTSQGSIIELGNNLWEKGTYEYVFQDNYSDIGFVFNPNDITNCTLELVLVNIYSEVQALLRLLPSEIDNFNNVSINRERISLFMGMYRLKAVDKTNRLVVSFNGDSIIGSQLDNITKSNEYLTGEFPPNMSKMIMARQFLDDYQFDDADVVYRNIIHSDWVKSSGAFEISNGKDEPSKTFNEIEVYGTANIGDSAEITVTGYKFFKLIWSEYTNTSKFQVLYSVNGGAYNPWSNASILPEYIEVTANSRCMQKYAILTLNPVNTYNFKIIATENPNNILFWGCEMWNNPRLDVVVEAYSGTIAHEQVNNQIEAYHSDWHNPSLVVSDILSINDYSFIVGSNETIDHWMTSNKTLYNRVIDNGIALLLFTPWAGTNYLTKNAVNVAIQNNLPYIDIQKKRTVLPPSSNICGPDGLHLSDYGNTYFYEELKRVLNDE